MIIAVIATLSRSSMLLKRKKKLVFMLHKWEFEIIPAGNELGLLLWENHNHHRGGK